MKRLYPLKIDIASHILPTKYKKAIDEIAPGHVQQDKNNMLPTLWDLDQRFKIMDIYEVMHVLTLSRPPLEEIIENKNKSLDLAKLANDEIAELVVKYPNRFPSAVATVSLNDINGSLKELERAITELKFRGVQFYTHVKNKPLDSPDFNPFWELMAHFNLPIWIHPTFGVTDIDYRGEKQSKYAVASIFGWPYETTVAMSRLVFSGVFDKWPNLKVITHHCGGGMIPFYIDRITAFHSMREFGHGISDSTRLSKAPEDYYKMFYADTALYGNTPGLMLGRSFFGIDKIIFGTDFPFGGQNGERVTRQTINAIEEMEIDENEKKRIYENNSRKLLRLPV